MKTNSKEVRNEIIAHILQNVRDYEDNQFTDIQEAKNHVKKEFERVANYPYNLKKFPNNQDRFSDYLCGLPFNFLFYNSDIQEYLNSLGINEQGKEYSDEKSLKLYHYLIYREISK